MVLLKPLFVINSLGPKLWFVGQESSPYSGATASATLCTSTWHVRLRGLTNARLKVALFANTSTDDRVFSIAGAAEVVTVTADRDSSCCRFHRN